MTPAPESSLQSFVLLRLGERRFALPASQVAELVAPSRIFRFPHKSAALGGVILRRGRMKHFQPVEQIGNGERDFSHLITRSPHRGWRQILRAGRRSFQK